MTMINDQDFTYYDYLDILPRGPGVSPRPGVVYAPVFRLDVDLEIINSHTILSLEVELPLFCHGGTQSA